MPGSTFTTMDTAKMIGQSIQDGNVFREFIAMHPGVGLLLGLPDPTMYKHGDRFKFKNLSNITGNGPRFHLDVSNKVAAPLLLGSGATNGEGAPVNFTFAQAPLSIQTGWAAMQIPSTIYESDMKIQKGQYLITENIAETEAARVQEAFAVQVASWVYGNALPDKNAFGGLPALVSDGLTTAQRQAAYTDRNGTVDDSAYKNYGVDSSDSAYANWRSYVKPWTTTIPTVMAMCNTIEKVRGLTNGKPTNVLLSLGNYQTQRDSLDTTNGAIITDLNTQRQDLGITGFGFRGNDFIMDPDIDIYCSTNMFALDDSTFTLHMKQDVVSKDYKRLDGILNAAWFNQFIAYGQLTLASRRRNIKWQSY